MKNIAPLSMLSKYLTYSVCPYMLIPLIQPQSQSCTKNDQR